LTFKVKNLNIYWLYFSQTLHVTSGPMRGLKQMHPMAQTHRQTDKHGDSMTDLGTQWKEIYLVTIFISQTEMLNILKHREKSPRTKIIFCFWDSLCLAISFSHICYHKVNILCRSWVLECRSTLPQIFVSC
jgi:hypothetical protein